MAAAEAEQMKSSETQGRAAAGMFSKAGAAPHRRDAKHPTAGTLVPTDSRTTSPPAEAPAAAGLAPQVTYRSLASDTADTEKHAQRRRSRNLA